MCGFCKVLCRWLFDSDPQSNISSATEHRPDTDVPPFAVDDANQNHGFLENQ
jgi:hypothetical protein